MFRFCKAVFPACARVLDDVYVSENNLFFGGSFEQKQVSQWRGMEIRTMLWENFTFLERRGDIYLWSEHGFIMFKCLVLRRFVTVYL